MGPSRESVSPSDLLQRLNGVLAGRYRLERLLGEGGMATVFLATDVSRQRRVALKVLRPELVSSLGPDRFLREILVTAKLDHPHIVPLFDSGEAGGFLFYAMPFVEGESLRQRMDRERVLPVPEAVRITCEVARALQYAHGQGVVHRDIKPENILLSGDHARVADFGIAKAVTDAGASRLTGTGTSLGTVLYMSPEQATGEEVDHRSDVYSLATVLYEMLAGEPPYRGATAMGILAKRWKEPVPRVSTVREAVPPALEQAITQALAKVPADRFATAGDFAAAIEAALLAPGRSRAVGASPARWSPGARRALTVAVWVLAVAVGILGLSRWRGGNRTGFMVQRLAVLPLTDLLGDSTQSYLVAGMHDALLTRLAEARSIAVIAKSSVMRYAAGDSRSAAEIARELGVDALVEGSVVRGQNGLELMVRLVEPSTQSPRWTRSYTTTPARAIALQDEVARAILLEAGLAAPGRAAGGPRREPKAEALDGHLKANYLLAKGTPSDMAAAMGLFEQAIQLDPEFAAPHAQLAGIYMNMTLLGAIPPHLAFDQAKTHARRAIELDDQLADAFAMLGYAYALYDWDWAEAEAAFQQALALNPSLVLGHALYANFLSWMSRHDEALSHARQAVTLDPMSFLGVVMEGTTLLWARRYPEAIAKFREILALEPNYILAHDRLCNAYDAMKRYAEAVVACEKSAAIHRDALREASLAHVYADAGRRDEARAILQSLLAREQETYVSPVALARIYLGLGEKDRALEWLETALRSRQSDLVPIRIWPGWDPLRDDARFQDIVRRMRYPN